MAELLASFMTSEPPAALATYQQCFLNTDVVTTLLEQPQEIPKFIGRAAGLVLSYTTTLLCGADEEVDEHIVRGTQHERL